jgi:hypothetical protein
VKEDQIIMADNDSPAAPPPSRKPTIAQPAAEPPESPTVEEHAATRKTPGWALACARAFHGWGIGQRMSAAEFDKAVSTAINHPAG